MSPAFEVVWSTKETPLTAVERDSDCVVDARARAVEYLHVSVRCGPTVTPRVSISRLANALAWLQLRRNLRTSFTPSSG